MGKKSKTQDQPSFEVQLIDLIDQEAQSQRYDAIEEFTSQGFKVGCKNAKSTPKWQLQDFANIMWEGEHDHSRSGFQLENDQAGTVLGDLLTMLTRTPFFDGKQTATQTTTQTQTSKSSLPPIVNPPGADGNSDESFSDAPAVYR